MRRGVPHCHNNNNFQLPRCCSECLISIRIPTEGVSVPCAHPPHLRAARAARLLCPPTIPSCPWAPCAAGSVGALWGPCCGRDPVPSFWNLFPGPFFPGPFHRPFPFFPEHFSSFPFFPGPFLDSFPSFQDPFPDLFPSFRDPFWDSFLLSLLSRTLFPAPFPSFPDPFQDPFPSFPVFPVVWGVQMIRGRLQKLVLTGTPRGPGPVVPSPCPSPVSCHGRGGKMGFGILVSAWELRGLPLGPGRTGSWRWCGAVEVNAMRVLLSVRNVSVIPG